MVYVMYVTKFILYVHSALGQTRVSTVIENKPCFNTLVTSQVSDTNTSILEIH